MEPPSPYNSHFPFESVEGDLFPPVCLRTHWDPTQMLRHILPDQSVGLPQDFRPWVKVCKNYVTSGPAIKAPMPPVNMVFPPGGEFYPPGRYAQAIDKESILRTLNQPLDKWCLDGKYRAPLDSDMYVAGKLVPDRGPVTDAFIQELAMPQAVLRTDTNTCRAENEKAYWERSPRFFNNPTKQDRYGAGTFSALPDGVTPMPHGGVDHVPLTSNAIKGTVPPGPPHVNGITAVNMPGGGAKIYKSNMGQDYRPIGPYTPGGLGRPIPTGSFAPA